jgi:hypothetical protein
MLPEVAPQTFEARVRRVTGFTRHFMDGSFVDHFVTVRIVPREESDEVFLVRYDADGARLTDTWHACLEDAKSQASVEFEIVDADWSVVSPPPPPWK